MKYKIWYFVFSILIVIPGLISLIVNGLKLSIDFTGGTLIEIVAPATISNQSITDAARKSHIELSHIQQSNDGVYLLKTRHLEDAQKNDLLQVLGKDIVLKRFETVGPTVGKELMQKAIIATIVASCLIVMYIAWSFHAIPKPYKSWKFGLSAVIALIHDILVVIGLFSIFGKTFGVEIDALFVTAILTIIGFSVHDTIVVFDRIRENLIKLYGYSFEEVVDYSISETLVRSLNTSFTVILTLSALLFFGGESIRWFVVALLIGITSGTYSSIFNAAPILVLWEKK